MSMKPYTYIVLGIKTTIEQAEADGIDLYECPLAEDGIDDVRIVMGEDTDDVLIGKILFETDPYDDADRIVEMTMEPASQVGLMLFMHAGIDVPLGDIKLYAITVWL